MTKSAQEVSRVIRRALRSAEAWAILDADPRTRGGTWSAGGCRLLAEALRAALGAGDLWMVTSPRRTAGDRAEHVVLRLGDDAFLDADGVSTSRALLGRMARRELIPSPSLAPMRPSDVSRSEVAAPRASVAALSALLADQFGVPRPNGVAFEREPKTHRRASVTILTDGVSDSFSVLTFVGRSTSGRRRIEGASEAFSYARKTADDLLRRGVVPEVRISFAVERVEHRVEIRVRREDGSIIALPWGEAPRMNPSRLDPVVDRFGVPLHELVIVASYEVRLRWIEIRLFRGMVGGTPLGGIDVGDFGVDPEDLEEPCLREYRALCRKANLPTSTPVRFTTSPRLHSALKNKGIGVWLYAEAARLAWLLDRAVIAQDACRASSTSLDALRAWGSSRLVRYVEDAHEPGDVDEVDLGDGEEMVYVDSPRVAVWRRRDNAHDPVPPPPGIGIVSKYRENPTPMRGVVAPAAVRKEFAQGLELHARGLKGKGLRPETVAEARDIARGAVVDPEKLGRMRGWFARHGASPGEVAARRRQAAALAAGRPLRRAPALVAWLLWGGDSGQRWVKSLR